MKVVILCGGQGIRIRDLSENLPKPMIPIGRYPIVHHIMQTYSRYGFHEFILCLGYKSWKFKEFFLNYRLETSDITIDLNDSGSVEVHDVRDIPPWKVTLAETGLKAMTGCRISRIRKHVGDEAFMLTYGDGVSDIDIGRLVEFHRSHGKLATVTSVRPTSRFGELVVEDNSVLDFQEKPQTSAGLINGGFFVCEPGVFDYISDNEACKWETDPLKSLALDGQLMTYVHDGFWMPMDTTREYILLNDMWAKGDAPWRNQDEGC